MTEKIDLDDLDVAADDEETPNRGDWFWRGDGDPEDEPEPSDVAGTTTEESDTETDDSDSTDTPTPHVPRENKDKPVGIPKEQGGAGGETSVAGATDPPDHAAASGEDAAADEGSQVASGPHGGGVDDMTLALTYRAMKRFDDPTLVVRDAKAWADWLGIVGDVEAFVINKFQRDHNVDVDFFSGAESPAKRLADIDKHSMFYAERMVLVGLPPEETVAEKAGWEFVPLSEAAEEADWKWTPDPDESG